MADHSKAQDPHRMAQLLLTQARNSQGPEEFDGIIRTAQVHATLAVADAITEQTKWIREVADQLDARPVQVQVQVDGKQIARAVEQGNKTMRKGGAA